MSPGDLQRNDEHFLAGFFEPRSVAIVGASNNPTRANYYLLSNLLRLGFKGRIYPVHPNEKEIQGLKAYPAVKDIPEIVDLAVIGVSYMVTPQVLKACIEKGIKRVTLIAGGFSESGKEGKEVQAEMARMVRQNGIRAIGPNALSPINVKKGLCISFHPMESIKFGGLSLIFQSGLYEPRSGWLLNDFNYHLNKLIDLGNKMDVNEVDALTYLVEDPDTQVIGIHMESIGGDGREFLRLIRKASEQGKRVIVLKSGRSEAGARAALSHTGALVQGNDRLFESAIRQCGALRAQSLEDFFDLTRALERFGPLSLKGNRVFIATFPGGEGVIVTDLLVQAGLRLAETSSETLAKLRPIFPAWDIPTNPWDLGLTVQFHHPGTIYPTVLEAMVSDPNVDALALQIHPEFLQVPKEFMEIFHQAAGAGKPVVLWLAGMDSGRHETLVWLEEKGVPVFSSPEKAIAALGALHRLCRS
ncbi:MAG: acetate--CoA ligase family protein, partial [Deltaproteobacteria bacterium]